MSYTNDIGLPEGTKLFINESLCPCCKALWNDCKKQWNKKEYIFSYFTVTGAVTVKLQQHGTYIDDLEGIFPERVTLS